MGREDLTSWVCPQGGRRLAVCLPVPVPGEQGAPRSADAAERVTGSRKAIQPPTAPSPTTTPVPPNHDMAVLNGTLQ